MNEIVNKFLLVGDKFMPEMCLQQPGFTYSVCGSFTKNKERIEKFMQKGNTEFIYRNDLDKACFQHDMFCGKSKDLAKTTQPDKVLRDKAFKIASDAICGGYQRGLASMFCKFFDKKWGIKYVGGERLEGFCGVMKYFMHILMGHEIIFKILDEP